MKEFAEIWKEQCRAAERIQENFGIEKALGYLIGEKLCNFIRAGRYVPRFRRGAPRLRGGNQGPLPALGDS